MNNSTVSFNSTPTPFPSSQAVSHVDYYILKAVLLVMLMVSGLVCNILVIVIITKNRHLRKSINCFILSMALSDIFVPFFSISINFQMIITNSYWLVGGVFGNILCKVVFFFSDLSPLISSLSLVFMTFDRFIAIVYPTKFHLRTPTFRKRLVVLSWLIPIVYCSKNFYSHKIMTYGDLVFCGEVWAPDFPHEETNTQFITFYTVSFVYIPFILLTVMYSVIIGTLYKQQKILKNNISCRLQQKIRQKQRRRVITLALAIVLAFLICYGPMNYNLVMQSFVKHWAYDATMSHEMEFFSFVLRYSNATVNPLICMIFHKDMRICVAKMLCCKLKCLRSNKTFNLKLNYQVDTLEMDKRTNVTTSTIRTFTDIGIVMGEENQHQSPRP